MKRTLFSPTFACVAPAMLAALSWSGAVRADITELQAAAESTVRQIVDGEFASTDTSLESFPGTAAALPLQTFAGLGDFLGQEDGLHAGRGIAVVADPTLSILPNPMDFGAEADAFSSAAEIAYAVESTAVETRRVVFNAAQLGILGGVVGRPVSSTVYFDGAMLLWSVDPARDLSGAVAEFEFSVIQDDGANGSRSLFTVSLALEGQANGGATLVRQGPVSATAGGPELLTASLDPEAANVVAALSASGKVHLVLVPPQSVTYEYPAAADQPFDLRAEVRCRAANLPGGTVVAVVFGRPFRELGDVLGGIPTGASGATVQRLINAAVQKSPAPPPNLRPVAAPLCGAMSGGAVTAGLVGMVALRGRRPYRRRSGASLRRLDS